MNMKIKFNKVTWYSKAIALAVFVTLPFIFFWLGVTYGETAQYIADSAAKPAGTRAAPAAQASQGTQVLRYEPPVPTDAMKTVDGSCFANSIAAPYRPDAWRCTVGNAIQDPCFQIGTGSSLFCGVDPEDAAASSAFVLSLSQPLPTTQTAQNPPAGWGWRVKLDDGTICTPFTGTLPFAAGGEVAKYGCGDQRLIFGDLNASSKLWTAKVGTLSATSKTFPPPIESSSDVPIATVWQ
jgi:hypothetical protein